MTRVPQVLWLVLLTVLSWSLPAWEYGMHGRVSVLSVVTALMFTAMLVAWPFLTGHRVHGAHLEHARMCRDCHALRWPGDLDVGFCLHCGSTRTTVAAPN